jgi:type I restriction enzyme S subunit
MDKMSSGSTVKHLSVPECKKFKVRVPKLVLQTKFEEICNKVNKLVNTNKDAADTPLFYSLSQKAFAGAL